MWAVAFTYLHFVLCLLWKLGAWGMTLLRCTCGVAKGSELDITMDITYLLHNAFTFVGLAIATHTSTMAISLRLGGWLLRSVAGARTTPVYCIYTCKLNLHHLTHSLTFTYTTATDLCRSRTKFSTTTHSNINNTAAACLYNFPSTATASNFISDLSTELHG